MHWILLEVDSYGLDKLDRRILQTMIRNFQGGPVGLETLAAAIGEDAGTLEDVYEPYLLQNGFLEEPQEGVLQLPQLMNIWGIPYHPKNNAIHFYTFRL